MKKLFLSLLFIISVFPQTDYSSLREHIHKSLNDDFFTSSSISLSIYDLTERQNIFELDSKKLLRPASNMKILTSSAGLLFLGEEYNFVTGLYYTGKIVNHTLYGDIIIKGGCDPDFTSKDLESLTSVLDSLKLFEITGSLVLDLTMKDSLFWGNGWMWDDDPSTDAPYMSALNINDNTIKVYAKPGKLLEKAILRTEPVTSYVNLVNNSITSTEMRDPFVITRQWLYRSNDITATGSISPADSEFAVILNLYSPENYFSTLFIENLRDKGIKICDNIKYASISSNAVLLNEIKRPFDTVIVNLNKISDNLSAEMILYAMAEKYYGRPGTTKNGLKLIDSLISLSGKNPSDYVYVDGSGVSHYNLITPDLINSILQYLYFFQKPSYSKLYKSFPIAGIDGTLRTRMRGTSSENKVHAKTGTLSGVSSLSGYAATKTGNIISFSIFVQNYKGSSSIARSFQDKICNLITSFGRDTSGQKDLPVK